jgi:hypothetical protein
VGRTLLSAAFDLDVLLDPVLGSRGPMEKKKQARKERKERRYPPSEKPF